MEHIEDLAHQNGKRHASLSLFLALYLMLLAFFITLLSLSSFEEERSARAVDSVNAAFSRTETTSLGRYTGDAGTAVQEARAFFDQTAGLLEAAIPAAEVTRRTEGRVMEVTLPVDALFIPGEARVREAHLRLVDRIIAGLNAAPRGYRYVMEIVTGSDYPTDGLLPLEETLAVARAGALARTMVERGAPASGVVAGVAGSERKLVRLTFSLVDETALRLDLGEPLARPAGGGATGEGAAPAVE